MNKPPAAIENHEGWDQQRFGAGRMVDRNDEGVMDRADMIEAADREHLLPCEQRKAAHHPGIQGVLSGQAPAQ
jgi:hypothetical protein